MSRSATPDYYELLGVPRDADVETITKAYRKLARVSHPDGGGNAGMFRLLRVAFETLTDEMERRSYDATLAGADVTGDGGVQPEATATASASTPDERQWQFEDGTTRSMIVDPERLSWWSSVDPERAAVVDPPYGQGRLPAICTSVVFGICGLATVGFHLVGVVPLAAGAVVLLTSYLQASRGAQVTAVAGVAGVLALVFTGVYMYAARPTFASLLGFGLLLSLGAGVVLLHRLGEAASLNRLAPPDAIDEREYGTPGAGRDAHDADRRFGDRVGADALLPLTFIPGVRVFHGLTNLSEGSVISHAITCGHLVALVESMCWEPGNYTWTPHGSLMRDGRHLPDGDLALDSAIAAYHRTLGHQVGIRACVLVATPQQEPSIRVIGPTGVLLGDPQTVVEALGDWFLQSGPGDRVDRNLLVQLRRHQVVAAGGSDEQAFE